MSNEQDRSRSPPPRQAISARAVLTALAEVQRHGHWPLFQQLERDEPDLAEHVLEQVSQIHQTLLDSHAPAKVVRRLQRQVQSLVLVTVLSVRAARSGHRPDGSTDDNSNHPSTQGDP
jgi:hypothetical protein